MLETSIDQLQIAEGITVYKWGRIGLLNIRAFPVQAEWNYHSIGILPEGWKPLSNFMITGYSNADVYRTVYCDVLTDGTMNVDSKDTDGNAFFSSAYFIA